MHVVYFVLIKWNICVEITLGLKEMSSQKSSHFVEFQTNWRNLFNVQKESYVALKVFVLVVIYTSI